MRKFRITMLSFIAIAVMVMSGVVMAIDYVEVPGGIANGSFENPVANNGDFDTLSSGSGGLDEWVIGGHSIDLIKGYWTAADGNQSLDMTGLYAGSITQQLTGLATGRWYKVTFQLAGNPDDQGGPTLRRLQIEADGNVETYDFDTGTDCGGACTRAAMGWTERSIEFQATSENVDLTFTSLVEDYGFGPALDDVRLFEKVFDKRLTSGPCVDDPEKYCENGVANGGFTYADGAEPFISGAGPKEMVAGYQEGGVSWDGCGIAAFASLTAGEGFVVSWDGLASDAPSADCNHDYNLTWYATLICDDRSNTIATTGFLNPAAGDFSGEVTATGTLQEHWDWILAVEACENPMVFVLAEQGGFPDGIMQEWVAYADMVPDTGNVAVVVETVKEQDTHYDFVIVAGPHSGEPYDVLDTFPAEWIVQEVNDDANNLPLGCGEEADDDNWMLMRGGKVGKKCHSDTDLIWTPYLDGEVIKFDVSTRPSPSCKDPNECDKFAPTSCGALYLNYGAESSTGELTNTLCLAAVEDLNEDGVIDYSGAGDEDGDSVLDFEEACEFGTDPCDFDSDDDGLGDGEELAYNCPDGSAFDALDPNNSDTDGDSLSDGYEDSTGLNPCDPDSDGDGVLDDADQCPLEGDAGNGVDATGCPIVYCEFTDSGEGPNEAADHYQWTWKLYLEGDGTIASGSVVVDMPGSWSGIVEVTGSFNPAGNVAMTAENPNAPTVCPASSDLNVAASCTGSGGSCTGSYQGFDANPVSCYDPRDWAVADIGVCELSNPSN